MNELERLIECLLIEMPEYRAQAESFSGDRFMFFRALVNLRPPKAASPEFLSGQDAYLKSLIDKKGITDAASLGYDSDGLSVWRGDITTLNCDGIVNAANSALLGCFCPNHSCIDNAIHTFAGVQLRAGCARIMEAQGHKEPAGQAKITPAYNLPSKYILHTVGPIVTGSLTDEDRETLASCYRNCLSLAEKQGLSSLAFCCISTGEFHFPNEEAARIAVSAVRGHYAVKERKIKVIFNVFKESDEAIYRRILEPNKQAQR